MSVTFNLWFLKANSVSNSSAVNIGTNLLIGWLSNSKSTNGVGSVTGDGGAMGALTASVDDRDLFDTPWFSPNGQCGAPMGAPSSGSPPLPGSVLSLWPPGA